MVGVFVVGSVLTGTTPALAGPKDYSFMQLEQHPGARLGRWNPCRTLTWDIRSVPKTEHGRMKKAFRKASSASGLRFAPVSRDADISIAWYKKRNPNYGGTGAARTLHWTVNGVPTATRVLGVLTFHGASRAPVQYRNKLYLHEIGHVIGLGHVNARDEVMRQGAFKGKYLQNYGSGDRAGFRVLYDNGKCVPEHPAYARP